VATHKQHPDSKTVDDLIQTTDRASHTLVDAMKSFMKNHGLPIDGSPASEAADKALWNGIIEKTYDDVNAQIREKGGVDVPMKRAALEHAANLFAAGLHGGEHVAAPQAHPVRGSVKSNIVSKT
jgi:alpha-D-ribose 1-methylphosphonate 5-triphosphate diphosphatase PhnM